MREGVAWIHFRDVVVPFVRNSNEHGRADDEIADFVERNISAEAVQYVAVWIKCRIAALDFKRDPETERLHYVEKSTRSWGGTIKPDSRYL